MIETLSLVTSRRETLLDITLPVIDNLRLARVNHGTMTLFSPSASTGILICSAEKDETAKDIFDLLGILIPEGVWLHDEGQGGADAHLKSALVGPSQSIPVMHGSLVLGPSQRILFCEFEGPRRDRKVYCSIQSDR